MTQGACEDLAQEKPIQIRAMRRHWTFSLSGPGMLWLFRVFWKFKRHFLKALVIRIWWGNKRAWVGRLLPTSDIVFKLFTKLVRAARRTVESGISSLCDVTFKTRGCQMCHSKLEQHTKLSFLRHLCLRRYFGGVHCILYSSGSSARRNLRNLRKSVNPMRPIYLQTVSFLESE